MDSDSSGSQVSPAIKQTYLDLLKQTLADLSHLNRAGLVTFDDPKVRIGGGSFSDIFIGTCEVTGRGRVKVAIKCLRFSLKDEYIIAKLTAKELYVWSRLEHKNVLPLLGYIIDEGGFPSLISEWMDNGSILGYVRRHSGYDVMELVLGVAEGLAYLHENNVIHSDVKSDNIMISSSGIPMISDFGISRAMNVTQDNLGGNTTYTSGVNGTARWMAYELLAQSDIYKKHSKESDVWSFGMSVYEILAKRIPYANLQSDYAVLGSVIRGILPSPPESFETWPEEERELWKICESCWIKDPSQRITMTDVIKKLKILKS